MNQPQQHVCLSGTPACSGCNPCPECQAYVQEQVLPSAFLASRMNETLVILHTIIGSLLERGVDPVRQMGLDLSRVFPTLEEQADAFFRGYVEGWGRMHEGMRTNPAIRARLQARVVSPDLQGLEATGLRPQAPGESEISSPGLKPDPLKPEAYLPPIDPFKEALRRQQEEWEAEDAQQAAPPPPPKPQPVPITVEEVASMGFPIDNGIRNGAS